MTEPILQVRNLKKYFPITSGFFRSVVGQVKAVDGIDFSIAKGEILGLVGESGSGKSTAARAAIRLTEPTSGSVFFMGQDLLSLPKKQLRAIRPKVQMVFQDPFASLNPRRTIGDSIGEPLWYHGMVLNKKDEIDKVVEILEKIGLTAEALNRYPHQFSGGQQQRICIGRAIALNPELIVCDEAVSALDVSVQAQILNLLLELKNSMNLSYLFISHDLSVIRHICDNVVVLYHGKVVETGPVEEIFCHPKHAYTKSLIDAMPAKHPKDRKMCNIAKEP